MDSGLQHLLQISCLSWLCWWILLQPLHWCCVECVIHHEQDVRKEQHHIYVARTSNNRVIAVHDLYCCLLPQYEALCTCCSSFSSRNKMVLWPGCEGCALWSLQKNVRSVRFIVKKRGCCCNHSVGVALHVWFTTNGMCAKNNTTYMWREHAIIEWWRRVISGDTNDWT